MLIKRELILVKIETIYNTDSVPAAATDAVLISNPSWAHEGARRLDRNHVKSTLDTPKKKYGGSLKSMSFDMEMKGSGAAGTAPEMAGALRACGLGETVVAATSVTYKPVSTSIESATIYYYQDGKRHILTGCRGNVSFNMSAGEYGVASFSFTGHIGTVADVALPTGVFDATEPVPLIGLTFTVAGFAAKINTLDFSLNNAVVTPTSISGADGFGEIRIGGRDVSGSFDPEDELVATKDFIAEWAADTESALSTGVIGSVAGNRYQVTMPAIAYRDLSPADRDQVRTLQIGFGAGISAGDDEISLAFT